MNTYVKSLQNEQKQQKSKSFNNVFKWLLTAITIFVVFFILISFGTIIFKGIETGTKNDNTTWVEILFGSEFHMPGEFAMGIIIFNTIWMSFLVLLISTPISVATSLFITRVMPKSMSMIMVSVVSILAAIPSVIYGSFGKYFLIKFLYSIGLSNIATDATLLSDVIVVSIMIMPTITLMSTTSILMVDRKLTDSSMALGATKTQTSIYVVLRSAKTGIIIGMLFALGRCLGEATALSMMTTQTNQSGVTFGLFQVSLFISPVIMNAFTMQGIFPSYAVVYEVLSALLLIVILLLFSLVKYIELLTDDDENGKKQSKKSSAILNIQKKLDENEIESISIEEGRIYGKEIERIYYNNYYINKPENLRYNEISSIKARSSKDSLEDQAVFKKQKTIKYNSLIVLLSMIGVLSLITIIAFLINTDLSLLFDWKYWTLKGRVKNNAGEEIWGIAIPLFGTFISVVVALAIAMPLGIAIAIYLDVYIKKGGKLSKIVSFAFQIMTSIPAVIYGTLAAIIFVKANWINANFVSFKPMFMLAIVILPTIIKQTNEGFRNVKKSQTEGSLALGATDAYTSRKIIVSQAMPAILAAAILAISIVMADSAIFITILVVKPETWSTTNLWLQNGGYTLSTNIYWISRVLSSIPEQREMALIQIKTIGIILMLFIFWLSLISQKIKNKNNKDAAIMSMGIILFSISPYIINGGIYWLLILGIILGIVGIMFEQIIGKIIK